jgi:hypothetical protein
VVAQVDAPLSTHCPRGSTPPPGTGEQWPIDDGSAQLTQAPPQATSQQMRSTQKPLAHSLALAQV